MLAEQICNGLPELAKKYVWDKQAKTADECATEADRWFLGTRLCDTKPGIKANYHSMRRPSFDARANGGNKISPTESGARGLQACWTCNSHTHLSNVCPENAFKAQLCTSCGKHHAPNVRCNDESASGVYSSFVGNDEIDKQYVFPLYVNSKKSTALRDTGNFGPVIAKTALIPKGAFIPGKHVYRKGFFDGRYVRYKLPVAKIKIRSPDFDFDNAVEIEVAVCGNACLPSGIDCNVGNSLFRQHLKLTDVLNIRPLSK